MRRHFAHHIVIVIKWNCAGQDTGVNPSDMCDMSMYNKEHINCSAIWTVSSDLFLLRANKIQKFIQSNVIVFDD